MIVKAWALRYRHNGGLMKDPNKSHPIIQTLLFRQRRDALAYLEKLSFKETIRPIHVEITIEPKLKLIRDYL